MTFVQEYITEGYTVKIIFTVGATEKSIPIIVIKVPPDIGPASGNTPVIVGGIELTYVNKNVVIKLFTIILYVPCIA